MSPAEMEAFLKQNMPLAQALGVRVEQTDSERACLWAPHSLNLNHMGTAFGGSLQALLILSCYAWLLQALRTQGLPFHVVLKESRCTYRRPVKADFRAVCQAPERILTARFFETLKRRGKAQIRLSASVVEDGESCCLFEGEFVAL